jgi:lauroyl/myristoyl acyltransferase
MSGAVLRALAPWLPRLRLPRNGDRIAALTGLSAQGWRDLARVYTELPASPGPRAASRRERLARLASRALKTGRWNLRLDLEGEAPGGAPCVYVTAHVGSLQSLRYALRARGVPAATVLGPYNLDRTRALEQDRVFDRRFLLDFPHALPASAAHRLRSALKRGSLIAAADLPEEGEGRGLGAVPARLLGGPAWIDPRPFRLARVAGVPCRAAFATLARGRWTLTVSRALAARESEACAEFARILARVASESPFDLDGVVYAHLAARGR